MATTNNGSKLKFKTSEGHQLDISLERKRSEPSIASLDKKNVISANPCRESSSVESRKKESKVETPSAKSSSVTKGQDFDEDDFIREAELEAKAKALSKSKQDRLHYTSEERNGESNKLVRTSQPSNKESEPKEKEDLLLSRSQRRRQERKNKEENKRI